MLFALLLTSRQSVSQFLYILSVIPTVREVLALPAVAVAHPVVVGGKTGLDKPVRWVHATDAADLTGLLQGGELVLTTGPVFAASSDQDVAYLQMLSDLGVVGVVVELGSYLTTFPVRAAEAADALQLPVITLDQRVRFIDVTERVHRLIVADRYDALQFAQATHETFTSLNMTRASPTDIVAAASQIVAAPVVLEDLSRRVLTFCPADLDAASLLRGWEPRSRRNATPGAGGWLTVPLGLGAEQWGRLVVPAVLADRDRARMALERAAQSLQLQRMLEQDREALLTQASRGLLEDLVSGSVNDEEEALTRASALGVASAHCWVPVAVVIERNTIDDALAWGGIERQVLTAARQALAAAGLSAVVSARHDGSVAMLVSCRSDAQVDESMNALLKRLALELGQRLRGQDATSMTWAAGAAPSETLMVAAAAGLVEAMHVAQVGLALPGPRRLMRSADVRLRGLFAVLATDPHVQAFARAELGRLIERDRRTGENLLGVLRAYLEHGGSKSAAAAATGLSRPTLYDRLKSLERVLGVSLSAPESRTSLHAALLVLDGSSASSWAGRADRPRR